MEKGAAMNARCSIVVTAATVAGAIACLTLSACVSTEARTRQAASRGQAVAVTWCSECHRVSRDQPSGARPGHVLPPTLGAPSFMAIADRPGLDRVYLDKFTSELHLPMPIYRLRPEDREDVVTYILSLHGTL